MNDIFTDFKKYLKYLIAAAAAVLIVRNISVCISWISAVFSVFAPLIIGCVFAFILNLIMKQLEKLYFPHSDKRAVRASRRAVCLALSILLIFLLAALIVWLIVPEIYNIVTVFGQTVPIYISRIQQWLSSNSENFPTLSELLNELMNQTGVDLNNIDWKALAESLFGMAKTGVGTLFTSTISFIGSFTGGIVNAAIGLVFSIYILYNKEKLSAQLQKLMKCYLKSSLKDKINYFCSTVESTFSSFITGQCTEAVILGVLCIIGMSILRLPYASTIGTLVGVTSLIPIVGAYIGAIVGALMILVIDPIKALIFIIFLIVLQQIEGNVIYPKVVGSSVGLPGIWVLAAVTVGGGFGGILGMLIGVPSAAVAYKLIKHDVQKRTAEEAAVPPESRKVKCKRRKSD